MMMTVIMMMVIILVMVVNACEGLFLNNRNKPTLGLVPLVVMIVIENLLKCVFSLKKCVYV